MRPDQGWVREWTLTYLRGEEEVTEPVADASVDELLISNPIRRATWHPNATARAGLRYLASTDEHQPHDSLFERNLLICVDFHGVTRVASQPFTLTWRGSGGEEHRHTPDFIIETPHAITVIDTRPKTLMNDRLLIDTAAIDEVCVHRGWQHALVVDYRRPAFTNIAGAAAHRSARDPLGYGDDIASMIHKQGGAEFSDLADAFPAPAIARAIIHRLIWDRTVSIDLNRLLGDRTLLWLGGQEPPP